MKLTYFFIISTIFIYCPRIFLFCFFMSSYSFKTLFTETNSPRLILLSCFFLFSSIIDLYFLILAIIMQIFNRAVELEIHKEIPTNEAIPNWNTSSNRCIFISIFSILILDLFVLFDTFIRYTWNLYLNNLGNFLILVLSSFLNLMWTGF